MLPLTATVANALTHCKARPDSIAAVVVSRKQIPVSAGRYNRGTSGREFDTIQIFHLDCWLAGSNRGLLR